MTRNDLILKMATEAGKAIVSIIPSDTTVIGKEGRGNYVTLADKTSEQIIFTLIREHFSQDVVLSEETESHLTEQDLLVQDHLWIIDPIDGTANYQHQRHYSCVAIAYAQRGVLKLAAIYDPFREQLYTAERGKGAFYNGKAMHVSTTSDISHASVITDNSYNPDIIRKHLETILKLPETPWTIMKGSLSLEYCEVANGQADIIFSFCPKPWDNAPGFLIMEEAGGVVLNRQGKPVTFFSEEIIAGNPRLVQDFIRITA